MTQEKILEGNRLIAKFMGWVDSPYENLPNKMYSEDLSYGKPLDQFNYHTSLDELMQVVAKIPTLKFKYGRFHVRIVIMSMETYCRIESKSKAFRNSTYKGRSLVEAIFITVVEFIEWYNQNKEK